METVVLLTYLLKTQVKFGKYLLNDSTISSKDQLSSVVQSYGIC